MQQFSCEQVRQLLFSAIDHLKGFREDFLKNPQSDFTRTRKISFEQTILFPMIAGSENTATELIDLFDEGKIPRPSAMIQRRNLISPEAFRELFFYFTGLFSGLNTYRDYQLVSCDGSRLNLPYNPADPYSFIQSIDGRKGINQVHLNALYDPLNDIFLDVEIQGIHEMDEKAAFTVFLDKYACRESDLKQIFLADRGYASFNIFAHACHNGQFFLIRVPESFARTIRVNDEHWLDEPTADEEVTVHIGRRRTTALRQLENYHYIHSSGHYDYVPAGSDEADCLKLRVVKFPISGDTFEYIVTNLPECDFPLESIKELYHIRWGQETAFRFFKYAGNAVHIHSLKKEFTLQEIYAKLTMYNFTAFMAAAAGMQKKTKKKTAKYAYAINHTQAQKICIRFLRGTIKRAGELIMAYVEPIRLGRSFKRTLRRQSADPLTYR